MILNENFSWEAWFIDSLIKVTIVLAIALCADFWFSRRRNFVLVSGLWQMAIVGMLVLPLAYAPLIMTRIRDGLLLPSSKALWYHCVSKGRSSGDW